MVKQAAKEAFVLILTGHVVGQQIRAARAGKFTAVTFAVHAGIGNEQKTSLML